MFYVPQMLDNLIARVQYNGMNNTFHTAPATWDNTFDAQPEGFVSPVRIRRIITRPGQARFQYWGLAGRWLPIGAEKAAMAIADWAAKEQGK